MASWGEKFRLIYAEGISMWRISVLDVDDKMRHMNTYCFSSKSTLASKPGKRQPGGKGSSSSAQGPALARAGSHEPRQARGQIQLELLPGQTDAMLTS
ncbi:unnamed protein product [Prunus armeniaca]